MQVNGDNSSSSSPPSQDHPSGASIRPVSTLLSHFENLAHTRSPSSSSRSPNTTTTTTTTTGSADSAGISADDSGFAGRVSLDLDRSRSPWTSTSSTSELHQNLQPQYHQYQQNNQNNNNNYIRRPSDYSNGDFFFQRRAASPPPLAAAQKGRPQSSFFPHPPPPPPAAAAPPLLSSSPPQMAPTLTVDSPRSPPRSAADLRDDESDVYVKSRLSQSPSNASRDSSVPPIPHRIPSASSRPATPTSQLPAPPPPREQLSAHPSPRTPSIPAASNGRHSPSPTDKKTKSTSLPPPVNRAEKPKIPAKPANLSQNDGTTTAAAAAPPAAPAAAPLSPRPVEDHQQPSRRSLSPFNTPPSSPERRPSGRRQPSTTTTTEDFREFRPPPRTSTEPLRIRRQSEERTPRLPVRDARELGFSRPSRPRTIQEPPRNIKPPPMIHSLPPPPQPPRPESIHTAVSRSPTTTADSPQDRPGLPPRYPPPPTRRAGLSPPPPRPLSKRATVDVAARAPSLSAKTEPPVSRTNGTRPLSYVQQHQPLNQQSSSPTSPQFLPPPPAIPRHTRPVMSSSKHDHTSPSRSRIQGEQQPSEEPKYRSDFPDSTQSNRRPPYLKYGPREIPARYETRVFDVCGRYVCTTGYWTRVWDLVTGEQIMNISHGETVKGMSVAFKPGQRLEDEGQRVWLGTSVGELHEVDISAQAIVSSRAYPSRREVIRILRHKKEMWTLDDEGRLLVWLPDESGTPNLQYSYHNPQDRVPRGHTFSMVAGDQLWLATGKEVHVYSPSVPDDEAFKILKRPLSQQHTGDVTSGAYTTKDGGRVYLGHADGKITVYSATDFSCITTVAASVYKINCLGVVGDYLWAAYNTGMMYVYDTTTNPWVVKKDWRAHDNPVSGFFLDASSLWTMNRLQVTSLGGNCIRLWDGTLEEDWLDNRMESRDVEFCTFREIKACIITWNAGASSPGSVRNSHFVEDAIHPENPPEIVIFGFQELVDLENKTITAKSLLMGSKKKESGEKEHMSRQYRVWIDALTRRINDCMPLDESYVLLHTANLVGLFTCIFVKHQERQKIKNVSAAEVKRGMGGLHGNKGALIIRFVLDDTSLCFVNCHLAAGQAQTAHRNNDIAAILESDSLPPENSPATRTDRFISGGDGSMIVDHEICILNGDLNYRIDSIPRNVIVDDIRHHNLPKLLDRDQLLASKRKNPGFRLLSFNEGPITFAPTYKYDVGTDDYDSSDKKRAPAWCDRILYRGLGRIKQVEYRRHEVRASDHRPVSAAFKLRIKSVLPKERASTWETCQQEFQQEKRRLASDASIEYLINVLGLDPEESRLLILGKDVSK